MSSETNVKRFRIAFSFAGEKRDFVSKTAQILAQRFGEEKILYDKFHEAEFADADLAFNLPELYKNETDLIVAVFSRDYEQKEWCGLEWRVVFSLIKENQSKRILLSRFNLMDGKGLFGLAGFIDLDDKTPQQFATLILQRLAINEGKPKNHYSNLDIDEATQTKSITNQLDVQHKNLAAKSLKNAPHFFQALQQDFANEQTTEHIPGSIKEMVDYFSTCVPDQVQELFYMVRRALKALAEDELDDSARKQTTEAASAMYCLAAIRLVDRAAHEPGNTILQVPRSENVICAIIATALFGGKLRLQSTENQLPSVEYVFEIQVPASGDHIQLSFERALYTVLFENAKDAGVKALDNQPLTTVELEALGSRLDDIKQVERDCLALIIHGYASHDSARPFAQHYQIPVMFPSNQATNLLLGMGADRLRGEISEFWKRVNGMRSSDVNSVPPNKPGTENMTNSGININAPGGTVVLSTGAHSAAQAGTHNTANIDQQQSVDLSPLTTKLNELQAAIAELSSAKAKDTFTGHLQTAQTELAKPKPDKNLIKKSLESVKDVGDAIEGGEKIVELCIKALPLLALLPAVF
ncbi:hypothetical protein A1359_09415 [Methylomonas lenta]|uniref:TIR domain-containing protein n=1 Tax=Methylomonas lenta TaxID=980561 RepID=A0A177NC43_9GAMM|nr:TIR domain-containing protein [Methylomonas lenta]OAI15618.1 hypothetical protein A1359_09415 [Methylomonas lenta]